MKLVLNWVRHHRKVFGSGLIVLLLVAIGIIVIQKLNSPAVGTISQQLIANTTSINQATQKLSNYSGQYISFTIPRNFDIITSPKSGGFLEVVDLYSNDHTGKLVAISIVSGTLDSDSGVSYRRLHPEIYTQQAGSEGSLVFTKDQNGSEYTGFLIHNDLVASVSLSSSYTKDLSADYHAIVQSWQWK